MSEARIGRSYHSCLMNELSELRRRWPARELRLGLVNNMPDSALEATERQFISLLAEASGGISIDLVLYALSGVPRQGNAASRVNQVYESVDALSSKGLDGLIVTGREPVTPNLDEEPYWKSFAALLEWARSNTHSVIWSCLAAHAAVLHSDGIKRIRSDKKLCGALHCRRITSHSLTEGVPSQFQLPHSRWNGLPEDQLTESGYRVLSMTEDAGVDSFYKDGKSLFVFFQGHPEYEPSTLLVEYRRDVSRYDAGQSDTYPSMPRFYFDAETANRLTSIQPKALTRRGDGLLFEVDAVLEDAKIESTWRPTAICLYRNWLNYLVMKKDQLAMYDKATPLASKKESGPR